MTTDTDTVSWYITFGIGTEWGHHYTEVQVPAQLSRIEQNVMVRRVAFDHYGKSWAFEYPPEHYFRSIGRYGYELREVLQP